MIDGAAVRVSLICFSGRDDMYRPETRLDGKSVDEIHSDLTARRDGTGTDLTGAQRIPANAGVAFMGDTKSGPFEVSGDLAREWLRLPANPNGRPNADVLKPWVNGMDVTRRPAGKWIVDFGWNMTEAEAALYEAPFLHVRENVWPKRQSNRADSVRRLWWRHERPRPNMWQAIDELSRYILTPRVSKHRLFVWVDARVCPDSATIAIARDDDVAFGILHSRFHEAWSLRLGTSLADRPRYTPTTTFETFPFPEGFSPDIPADDYADDPRAIAIADTARKTGGTPRPLAEPARMGGMDGRTGAGLSEAARRPRRCGGEGAEGPYADEPVQRPSAMARRCAHRAGRRSREGLRMGHGDFRRRGPAETAGAQLVPNRIVSIVRGISLE